MLYLVLILVIFLFSLPFLLRVGYIIEYDKDLHIEIKLLFIKKTIFSKAKLEKFDPGEFSQNVNDIKNLILDLYKKFKSSLKLKSVYIKSKIATSDPYLTAISYGAVNGIIFSLIGFLDSCFELKEKRTKVTLSPDFLDTQSTIFVNLNLYTSLFSFIVLSTYAFLKSAIKGGKNGRKQAKRNDKSRT